MGGEDGHVGEGGKHSKTACSACLPPGHCLVCVCVSLRDFRLHPQEDTLHARRQAARVVRTREHVKKLFDVLGPRYA
jgi:hypothetical protein